MLFWGLPYRQFHGDGDMAHRGSPYLAKLVESLAKTLGFVMDISVYGVTGNFPMIFANDFQDLRAIQWGI